MLNKTATSERFALNRGSEKSVLRNGLELAEKSSLKLRPFLFINAFPFSIKHLHSPFTK
jgi:hypothetical protein